MKKQIGMIAIWLSLTLEIVACGSLMPGLNAAGQDSASSASTRPTTAKTGDLAPEISGKSMTGDQIVLSQMEGHPVLVNFWATWCGPCRAEFPALERAYKKYKDQGLVVLGVNSGDDNSDEGVLTFMRNSVVSFPIVRDPGDRLGRNYRVNGLPTSFFVDRKGVIRDIVVGGPMTDEFITKEYGLIAP